VVSQRIDGLILSDQAKSLDWKVMAAQLIEQANTEVVSDVQAKLLLLIQ